MVKKIWVKFRLKFQKLFSNEFEDIYFVLEVA
jgi:hypothetical protein